MLTEANAFRTDGLITVELIGKSPTTCDEVSVDGYYPGTVMNCAAQIFIREGRKPGFENVYCTLGLGNIWTINKIIHDNYSKAVEIFINNYFVKKIRVREFTFKGLYNFIL